MVLDFQHLLILVEAYLNLQLAQLALEVSARCEGLHLLGSVHCIGHKLAKEDFVVRIKELFDDGEYVFRGNPDFTFECFVCHFMYSFV